MSLYYYVEERYCIPCKRNVGVECHCESSGERRTICLNADCKERISSSGSAPCFETAQAPPMVPQYN